MPSTKTLIHVHLHNLETELSKGIVSMGFEPICSRYKNATPLIGLQKTDIREDANLLAEFQQKPLHKLWMGLK